MQITIADTTFTGDILHQIALDIQGEKTTLKQLIEARVRTEVSRYNQEQKGWFQGMVRPPESEKTPKGYKIKPKKAIDPEKQVYTALDSFTKNGFFALVDGQQVDSLNQEILVSTNTEIHFIQLTPLVGG